MVAHEEAVARAFEFHRAEGRLVVLGDGVDSTNAGAPGDSNTLLRALLGYVWPGAGAMCAMVSPDAVAAAEAAGEGACLSLPLGAHAVNRVH